MKKMRKFLFFVCLFFGYNVFSMNNQIEDHTVATSKDCTHAYVNENGIFINVYFSFPNFEVNQLN